MSNITKAVSLKVSAPRRPALCAVLAGSTLMLLGLAGCSLAPDYHRAALPLPPHATQSLAESSALDSLPDWQRLVKNQGLLDLIQQALAQNTDLRQVLLNVAVAKTQYGVQRSEQLPHLQIQASSNRQLDSADLSGYGGRHVDQSLRAGIGLTAFELDLFGRMQNLSEAALQQYLAVEANAKAARLSLVTELMTQYISYQSVQQQLALTTYTWQSRVQELSLIQQKIALGAANNLEVQDALGLEQSAKAELHLLERKRDQLKHSLQLLVGHVDVTPYLTQSYGTEVLALSSIQTGLSSELLLQRPDIIAAERQLQAQHAQIGVARAAFFPRISLTGFLGSASSELSDLFGSDQRVWSFVPELSVPLFDAGSRSANLTLAELRKDIAVAAYERQIQIAFREVSDALTAVDRLQPELAARQSFALATMESRKIAQKRYQTGVDSQLRYLDAQRQSYSAQQAAIQTNEQLQHAQVSLYKALGGGWQTKAS